MEVAPGLSLTRSLIFTLEFSESQPEGLRFNVRPRFTLHGVQEDLAVGIGISTGGKYVVTPSTGLIR